MSRTHTDLAVGNLSGRRAVVTGASDGIGLAIATRLAQAGAEVIMPVRNRRKGDAAVASIHKAADRASVSLRDLDLSSLSSVAALGESLLEEDQPIHILINNAGVMAPPHRQETEDGFELQFGSNHLGHFALVGHLLPLLKASRARVTSQISVAANQGAINWDDLNWKNAYHPMNTYSQSKIALGLFGLEFDRRSRAEGWGIISNLSHPGVAPTGLLNARPEIGRSSQTSGRRMISLLSRLGLAGTPQSAGLPALLAATSSEAKGGAFYGPRGIGHIGGGPAEQTLYSRLRNSDDASRLWQVSEELTSVRIA